MPEPASDIVEPPLPSPGAAAPPLPATKHIAPRTALVLGLRAGVLIPLGSIWQDGEPVGGACCKYRGRSFSEFASPGPAFELNVGARLARHYSVFALWEYATLGRGNLENEFGGQERGSSHFVGGALRFSTNPDDVGFLIEMALGWRRFQASWENGTELTATDNFLNARLGLGVDFRINRGHSISAMATLGGGVFSDLRWRFADGSSRSPLGTFDQYAQHVPLTIEIGTHFDAITSAD